jgi:hypothetical protein
LPKQALIAGQVDESGIPRVNPHPASPDRAALPAGFSRRVSSMPNTRTGDGSLSSVLAWQRRRGARSATVPMSVDHLGRRAGGITDRHANLGAQLSDGARPRRDLRNGLGERPAPAVVLPTAPAGLGPRTTIWSSR